MVGPGANYLRIVDEVSQLAVRYGRSATEITVVAVSKRQPLQEIEEVFDVGCRDFGESRVQEALSKRADEPLDIRWHLIGSLQKNKVNKVAGRFALVHSVDTPELAHVLSRAGEAQEVTTSVLLQVNTSGEMSKHGWSPAQWLEGFEELLALPGIEIEGLMTMAPLTDDVEIIRDCFAGLRRFRDDLQTRFECRLPHLSMGMSQDYEWAIAEGATLLRIGTAIFS